MKYGYNTSMKKIIFKNVVWKEGKDYIAQSLNVNVSSFGATKIEAIRNLKEAVELYFEGESKRLIVPVEKPQIINMRLGYA